MGSGQKRMRDDRSAGPIEKNPTQKTPNSVGVSSGVSQSRKSGGCWSCGGKGHLERDCRKKNLKCFQCNQVGHVKKDCPGASTVSVAGPQAQRPVQSVQGSHRAGAQQPQQGRQNHQQRIRKATIDQGGTITQEGRVSALRK